MHTPTPWRTYQCGDGLYRIRGPQNANVGGETTASNARHIVRCVNSHDALVEALERLLIAFPGERSGEPPAHIVNARAALKLAGEG